MCACRGRRDAYRLPCQGTLAHKVARLQHRHDGFLADLGDDGDLYRSFLDVHDVLADVSLREDGVLRLEFQNGSCQTRGFQKGLDIEGVGFKVLLSFRCAHGTRTPSFPGSVCGPDGALPNFLTTRLLLPTGLAAEFSCSRIFSATSTGTCSKCVYVLRIDRSPWTHRSNLRVIRGKSFGYP